MIIRKKFRHVSASVSVVNGRNLNSFGQQIELTDEEFNSIKGERMPALLPEKDFADCGFTEDELKKFANSRAWESAPTEFNGKVRKAWAKFAEIQGAATIAPNGAPVADAPAPAAQPTAPLVEKKK